MRSRYCAYAINNYKYIVKTDYNKNEDVDSIKDFSQNTTFQNLKIIEFIDGQEESYVTFKDTLSSSNNDCSFTEKSRFIKENNIWYYIDGIML